MEDKVIQAHAALKAAEVVLHAEIKAAYPVGMVVSFELLGKPKSFPVKEVIGGSVVLDAGNGKQVKRTYLSLLGIKE